MQALIALDRSHAARRAAPAHDTEQVAIVGDEAEPAGVRDPAP